MTDMITIPRNELQQAVEFIDSVTEGEWPPHDFTRDELVNALRARLAQPEPKPVAWLYPDGLEAVKNGKCWTAYGTHQNEMMHPLYTAPPQREWQGLTDDEILKLFDVNGTADSDRNVAAVLRDARKLLDAVKEKNT